MMEEMQQKYMEYQMLDQRIKQMQEQMEVIENQKMEALATLQSMDDFSNLKEGDEILVPINNGIFAKAKFIKEDKVRVNVGGQLVVDKSIEETKKLIEKQSDELNKISDKIVESINILAERAGMIEKELSKNV